MNEQKTASILQRVPVILAVTAASYGLPVQGQAQRAGSGDTRQAVSAAPVATTLDRQRQEPALQD